MKCLHKNFVNIIHNLEKKIPKGELYGGQTICKRLAEEQHEKHKVDKIKNKRGGTAGRTYHTCGIFVVFDKIPSIFCDKEENYIYLCNEFIYSFSPI